MNEEKDNCMAVILTLSLATLIGCMNMSIFNVALPALMVYFNTDVTTIQWLASGFTLAAGVITPIVGFLGDRFSYKRTLDLAAIMVLVLSIVGVFSWCIEALIVVRVLFGFAAGMLMPLSLAMLYRSVPRHQQAKAAGIWGTANVVGGAIPSVLAGAIITYASWHVLLLIMIPLSGLLLFCSAKFLQKDLAHGSMKLDTTGFALTTVGSFVLLFAFSNLATWGISAKFIIATVIGFICMGVYAKNSWGKERAMLNLSVLRYPRYVAALITDCMNIIGMYMITFVIPLFLQNGLGWSAVLTGTVMLPASFMMILAMPVATKVLSTQGEKTLAIVGVGILLLGSSAFLNVYPGFPVALVIGAMCVRCLGMAFLNLMSTNTCMAAVPPELSGHASALTNWVRQMISALIVSVASTIISIRLATSGAQTVEEISAVYLSSTELLFTISCLSLISIVPIALKFFRSKSEMQV